MIRQFLLLICFIILVSCQGVNEIPRQRIGLDGIRETCREGKIYPIKEIYNPSDIYSIGDHVVVVNNNRQCNVFYLYHRDNLMFDRAFGSYGRASNEFLFIDRSPRQNTDSTLFLYTNFVNCSEFRINGDTVQEINRLRITDDIRNNVILLNDTLVFYRALQSDCAFNIYNYKQKKNHLAFGDFPRCPIKYKTETDRDNICVSTSVYSPNRRRLLSFYESLPLIKIFNTNTYECIQEIELTNVRKQITSLQAYYDDENVVYFSRPVATKDRIYVSLINHRADFVPEHTVLLEVDWTGNIVEKYVIDKFCPIYTVTETGEFYGIALCDNATVLCKAEL